MKKYKVEFEEKHYYVFDVLAKDETEAMVKAQRAFVGQQNSNTEHYYESRDPESEVFAVYDVTDTDDPFNPM